MVKKNIYEIKPDFDNFRYALPKANAPENKMLTELFFNLPCGYSLAPDFPTFKFELFVDRRKRKDKRRMDFNVSCWNSEYFICDYDTKLKVEKKFGNKFELFPVETDLDRDFYYVNCLTAIDAIKAEDRDLPYDELKSFLRDNIKDEIIFKDNVFNFYYVTDEFVKWVEDNDIKGMRFTLAGYM